MSRHAWLLVALLAGGAAPSAQTLERPASPAAARSTPLTGTVVDAQSRPLAGAVVTVNVPGAPRRTLRVGHDGAFAFDGLPAVAVEVSVAASGFSPLRRRVEAGEGPLRLRLDVAPVVESVSVVGIAEPDLARVVSEAYDRNKSVTTVTTETLVNHSPVANYAALRLLPGVMNAGQGGRDRFSVPSHIRGGHAWGTVETIDQYPSVNITPVSAEDGGYTAGLSSIIPAIAVRSLGVATGGLGVSYGQASGGVVRNVLKRGSAASPAASLRIEGLSLGEGLAMGDTGGAVGRVDYYVAAQQSLADYDDAYDTFARPIEGLRLASALTKIGVRTSERGRWETLYIAGSERHDYYQDSLQAGQPIRRDYHTDKTHHFLASRYDWRASENLAIGAGVTQNWFRENRIEETGGAEAIGVSRRNRPQRATRVFTNVNWRRPLGGRLVYTSSGGMDLTWDRFEDRTAQPIAFAFREQAAYSRHSLAFGDAVTLNGGVRVANIHNGFRSDVRLLYDAGGAWVVPATRTRVFGSWSTGYKLNKAFYLWWGNGAFIRRWPSPGLRPSTTETVELGAEQPISLGAPGAGTIRVAVFRATENDLFNFANTLSGVPFYDGARTRGVELWTEWRVGRLRPFASFTWLRSYRDRSTNPEASNVDLRFAPLPNYVAGYGTGIELSRTLSATLSGFFDDGAVTQQVVNDDIQVTRFGSFARVNASVAWAATQRWGLFARVENVLNRRNMGFDRTIIAPDGSARRVAGVQRDPGTIVSAGLNLQF